jgi:uncharacterized damage-inducible protein DinB
LVRFEIHAPQGEVEMNEPGVFADLTAGWSRHQSLMIASLEGLSLNQLSFRPVPTQRSVSEIGRHIVAARIRWCRHALGIGDTGLEKWAAWEKAESPEPHAAELVGALSESWQPLAEGLARWTADEYAATLTARRGSEEMQVKRGWVVWHLIEHDLHHGGEISWLLGMQGLPGLGA